MVEAVLSVAAVLVVAAVAATPHPERASERKRQRLGPLVGPVGTLLNPVDRVCAGSRSFVRTSTSLELRFRKAESSGCYYFRCRGGQCATEPASGSVGTLAAHHELHLPSRCSLKTDPFPFSCATSSNVSGAILFLRLIIDKASE